MNSVLQGGLLWAGEEFSPPWGPGVWGHGADVTARADVEHQDRPKQVNLAHKTSEACEQSDPACSGSSEAEAPASSRQSRLIDRGPAPGP